MMRNSCGFMHYNGSLTAMLILITILCEDSLAEEPYHEQISIPLITFLVKGYKDDWVTKEAVAEDADLAENPAEGKQGKELK